MEAIRREHDIWSASQSKGEQIYFPIKWLERNGGDYTRGGDGGQEVLLHGFFPCASSFFFFLFFSQWKMPVRSKQIKMVTFHSGSKH